MVSFVESGGSATSGNHHHQNRKLTKDEIQAKAEQLFRGRRSADSPDWAEVVVNGVILTVPNDNARKAIEMIVEEMINPVAKRPVEKPQFTLHRVTCVNKPELCSAD